MDHTHTPTHTLWHAHTHTLTAVWSISARSGTDGGGDLHLSCTHTLSSQPHIQRLWPVVLMCGWDQSYTVSTEQPVTPCDFLLYNTEEEKNLPLNFIKEKRFQLVLCLFLTFFKYRDWVQFSGLWRQTKFTFWKHFWPLQTKCFKSGFCFLTGNSNRSLFLTIILKLLIWCCWFFFFALFWIYFKLFELLLGGVFLWVTLKVFSYVCFKCHSLGFYIWFLMPLRMLLFLHLDFNE